MDEKNIKSEIISFPKYYKYSVSDDEDEPYDEEDIIFFHHFYKVSKF